MVINENLAIKNYESGATLSDKTDGYQYFEIAKLSNLDLVDGKTYTVSFVMEQSKKGCGEFNAGPLSYPPTALMDHTKYEIKDRSSFKFTYNKSTQESIAVYTDLVSRKAGVGATLKYVKIEEGDKVTPYIPSKNSLDTSKQAVFLAGGVFQEVYPL